MVLENQVLPYLQWLLYGGDGQTAGRPAAVSAGARWACCWSRWSSGSLIAAVAARPAPRRRLHLPHRRRRLPRTVPHLAAPRLGACPAGGQGIHAPPRVVALGVFFVILLFAGWFLNADTRSPAAVLSVVLTATTYLVLVIALLLSAFSLPNDFKTKTIYTVSPSRARRRHRPRPHPRLHDRRHRAAGDHGRVQLRASCAVARPHARGRSRQPGKRLRRRGQGRSARKAQTTDEQATGTRSRSTPTATAWPMMANGHTHDDREGGDRVPRHRPAWAAPRPRAAVRQAAVHRPQRRRPRNAASASATSGRTAASSKAARPPRRSGRSTTSTNRSTPTRRRRPAPTAAGADRRVFRTYKGDIGSAIRARSSSQIRIPKPVDSAEPLDVSTRSTSRSTSSTSARADSTPPSSTIDLFKDLVTDDGQIEVLVQCLEQGQYYGFAQADCYLRLPDGSPLGTSPRCRPASGCRRCS